MRPFFLRTHIRRGGCYLSAYLRQKGVLGITWHILLPPFSFTRQPFLGASGDQHLRGAFGIVFSGDVPVPYGDLPVEDTLLLLA